MDASLCKLPLQSPVVKTVGAESGSDAHNANAASFIWLKSIGYIMSS